MLKQHSLINSMSLRVCSISAIILGSETAAGVDDHASPHFHAIYTEHEALIEVNFLSDFAGSLLPRALGFLEWASMHRDELLQALEKAVQLQPLARIEPLP